VNIYFPIASVAGESHGNTAEKNNPVQQFHPLAKPGFAGPESTTELR
jgi:hypothetical protein